MSRKTKYSIMFLISVLVSGYSVAGTQPLSLQRLPSIVTGEGNKLAVYKVKCSTRAEPLISESTDMRQWCVESGAGETCFSEKIEAAQSACEASLNPGSQVLLAQD